MKTLLIVYTWDIRGGLEQVTLDIAKALTKAGAPPDVLSVFENGIADGIKSYGYFFYRKGNESRTNRILRSVYNRFWKVLLTIKIALTAHKYDLIISGHPHLFRHVTLGGRLFSRRPKYWVWIYGLEVWGDMILPHKSALKTADMIVSISKYTADRVSGLLGSTQITIIPPAVDTDYLIPGPKEKINRDEILIVGRLAKTERYKGHDILIAALPHIERILNRNISLTIVGDGDDTQRLKDLAKESPCQSRIHFTGRVSQKRLKELLQRCSLFAMPSRVECRPDNTWTGEGFGIVYVEAAACGRPVIASIDGGASETIIDGVTGHLVSPLNIQDVAKKISSIMLNPKIADKMGEHGRTYAQENFSIARFNTQIARLLDETRKNSLKVTQCAE